MTAVHQQQTQTAEGRLAVLEKLALDYNRHLETVPGGVLPPALRLAVAQCARSAFFCKACAAIQGTCFPKFMRFYDILQATKFEKPITLTSTTSINGKTAAIATLIVHATINFQDKLDKDWYDDCLKAVRESGLVDASKYGGDQKEEAFELACYSAISEIVILATMAHGTQMLFLVLDKPVPKLPTAAAAGPSYIDLTKLLYRWHRNPDKCSAAPYYTRKDLNTSSVEFQRLQKATQEYLPNNLAAHAPVVGLYIAPDDYTFFLGSYMQTVYLDREDRLSTLFGRLNPKKHCPSVSRNDLETVAAAIAGAHKCHY